jgi:hypothetical protein
MNINVFVERAEMSPQFGKWPKATNTVRSEKKNRVGADQTFQLAIREISINRCQS